MERKIVSHVTQTIVALPVSRLPYSIAKTPHLDSHKHPVPTEVPMQSLNSPTPFCSRTHVHQLYECGTHDI